MVISISFKIPDIILLSFSRNVHRWHNRVGDLLSRVPLVQLLSNRHRQIDPAVLMIRIIFQRFFKLLCCLLLISCSQICKPHQIIAVSLVFSIHIIVENKEIREGYCEEVIFRSIIHMPLAVIHQLVKA